MWVEGEREGRTGRGDGRRKEGILEGKEAESREGREVRRRKVGGKGREEVLKGRKSKC